MKATLYSGGCRILQRGLHLSERCEAPETTPFAKSYICHCQVSEWLNQSVPLPTWNALVAVLRTQLVGEKELADTLHERFCSEASIPPADISNDLNLKPAIIIIFPLQIRL